MGSISRQSRGMPLSRTVSDSLKNDCHHILIGYRDALLLSLCYPVLTVAHVFCHHIYVLLASFSNIVYFVSLRYLISCDENSPRLIHTTHNPNAGLMLAHRLRRWPTLNQHFGERLMLFVDCPEWRLTSWKGSVIIKCTYHVSMVTPHPPIKCQ